MKFLCVSCDEPMKFIKADAPEEGSVSIIFGCSKCNNQIAMLTNPQETQLVRTLGVNIGEALRLMNLSPLQRALWLKRSN